MGYKPTLCWSCKNACGGCSWSKSFAPVEGWTARPTKVVKWGRWKTKSGKSVRRAYEEQSYHVEACPLYQREKKRKVRRD